MTTEDLEKLHAIIDRATEKAINDAVEKRVAPIRKELEEAYGLSPAIWDHAEKLAEAAKRKAMPPTPEQLYRRRILNLVKDKLEEVHNHIGGVVGYTLNLTTEETEHLLKEIERQ